MQIILQEDELNQAIKDYINKAGVDLTGSAVNIELTVGRGKNATNTAAVDINSISQSDDNLKDAAPVEEQQDLFDKDESSEETVNDNDEVFS